MSTNYPPSTNHPPSTNLPPSTNALFPTNSQSPIPNPRAARGRLYAALYRPPQTASEVTLAALARDFSPRFEVHGPDLVVIDVAGLERLLGAPSSIGDELRRAVTASGFRAHVALAATQTAAMVLAYTRPGLTVVPPDGEAAAIAPVAVGILAKFDRRTQSPQSAQRKSDPEGSAVFALAAFQRWGVRTLGELAALPAPDLVARFGRGAAAWQAVARGEDQRPLVPTLDDERFESTIELEWPIEGLEPLSFVLTRLLEPLCTRLERRDRGAAVLHVALALVDGSGSESDGAADATTHTRRLELPTPMRDVRALRTLALLDLESHPPAAPIERVTIVIEPTPGRVLQHTLYTRPHPTPEQLSTLLARLGAVMGQDRVGAPMLVDTYRPGAFAVAPFRTEHGASGNKSEVRSLKSGSVEPPGVANMQTSDFKRQTSDFTLQTSQPTAAVRRCRQPVPARVAVDGDGRPVRVTTDRRGYPGGAVLHGVGPWRTSGDWWCTDGGKSEGRSLKSASGAPPDQPAGATRQTANFRLQTSHFKLQTSPWDRDEWDVALGDGGVYRIFRDRATDAWFIDAIVD